MAFAALLAAACSKPPKEPPRPPLRPTSLATVRRTVEQLLSQLLDVHQHTNLESCLLRLASTPHGLVELATIAGASPFAAWAPEERVFFYSYNHVFADAGSVVHGIGGDGRERFALAPFPLRNVRCVHLDHADGRLCVRVEIAATGFTISFATEGRQTVLERGRQYDLFYERRTTAATSSYTLVATRAVD